jgi:hypothetical protein
MKKASLTEKTLSLLLSGRGRTARKYAGKHVLVVRDRIVPLKTKSRDAWRDIERLKREYGETPIITFVPCPDLAYILCA